MGTFGHKEGPAPGASRIEAGQHLTKPLYHNIVVMKTERANYHEN